MVTPTRDEQAAFARVLCQPEIVAAMFFKLFRKPSSPRPRFEQDAALAEAHARRVSEIAFRPSKGFLKDQSQPKRELPPPAWTRK